MHIEYRTTITALRVDEFDWVPAVYGYRVWNGTCCDAYDQEGLDAHKSRISVVLTILGT